MAIAKQGLASLSPKLALDTPLRLPFGSMPTARHLFDIGSHIELIKGDMFKADVSGASLVFMYSTCFAPLMDAIGEKLARELTEGALVSTTTYRMKHPAFKLFNTSRRGLSPGPM